MSDPVAWYREAVVFGFSVASVWIFLSPLVAGFISATLTYKLRARADREKKKREWLAHKLEEAYLLVTEALEHKGMHPEEAFQRKLKLEKAINSAALYGDQKTRLEANKIAQSYAEGKDWVLYDPLLTALRDQFRRTMDLDAIAEPVQSLHFALSKSDKAS